MTTHQSRLDHQRRHKLQRAAHDLAVITADAKLHYEMAVCRANAEYAQALTEIAVG